MCCNRVSLEFNSVARALVITYSASAFRKSALLQLFRDELSGLVRFLTVHAEVLQVVAADLTVVRHNVGYAAGQCDVFVVGNDDALRHAAGGGAEFDCLFV